MSNNSANTKRIATNAFVLYIRMFLTMLVGLYTSRVVLEALGIDDFGIYNLVGGFVAMFSVVQSGLVSASQRFINVSLSIDCEERLGKLFSTIVVIYIILAVSAFVLIESFGLYFMKNHLVIPIDRMAAASWVFQLSAVMLIATLMGAPFNALIIAHEKMPIFAYVSIFDAFAKLGIAEMIFITTSDKLVVYVSLLCVESVLVSLIYWIYCYYSFKESRVRLKLNWSMTKEIYSFAIWSMFGGIAYMGFTQGVSVIMGMFFAPATIAARGVAVQVQGVVKTFANNFQTAVNPQIIKSYAKRDTEYFEKLLTVSAKYSYILLFMISLPFIFEADSILGIWLVEVPENSSKFLLLLLGSVLFDSMTTPYERAIHASGKIRNYSVTTSLILLLIVPFSYFVLKYGAAPYSVFVVQLIITLVAIIVRMQMAKRIVHVDLVRFVKSCLLPIVYITISSLLIVWLFRLILPSCGIGGIIGIVAVCVISVVCTTVVFGMSKVERLTLLEIAKRNYSNFQHFLKS